MSIKGNRHVFPFLQQIYAETELLERAKNQESRTKNQEPGVKKECVGNLVLNYSWFLILISRYFIPAFVSAGGG